MSNRCYGGNFKEGEETDWTDPEEVCEEDIDIVFPSERQGGKGLVPLFERPAHYLQVDIVKYDRLLRQVQNGIHITRCIEFVGYSPGVRQGFKQFCLMYLFNNLI